MANYNDDAIDLPKRISDVVNETTVPVWVRMEKYKSQVTRDRPDGMRMGPVIRIGTMDSPEVVMHGYHHNCGLFHDYTFDGDPDTREDGGWMYYPFEVAGDHGDDVSVYECDKCGKHLYRDDFGRRMHNSACLMDGSVVCRECEWHGLIAHAEVQERVRACRHLAAYADGFGKTGDVLRSFERGMQTFERKVSGGGNALQTRLWLDGDWSFSWSTLWLDKEAGEWKRYMHGGFILHGPRPLKNAAPGFEPSPYSFEQYDYGTKAWRNATVEEVSRMNWSIHT